MYMNLKPNKHKIISFNTTTMTSLGFIIVGTPLAGVQFFLLERGDKPLEVGGGHVEMGGLPLFYYFTVQSYLLCVRGK